MNHSPLWVQRLTIVEIYFPENILSRKNICHIHLLDYTCANEEDGVQYFEICSNFDGWTIGLSNRPWLFLFIHVKCISIKFIIKFKRQYCPEWHIGKHVIEITIQTDFDTRFILRYTCKVHNGYIYGAMPPIITFILDWTCFLWTPVWYSTGEFQARSIVKLRRCYNTKSASWYGMPRWFHIRTAQ